MTPVERALRGRSGVRRRVVVLAALAAVVLAGAVLVAVRLATDSGAYFGAGRHVAVPAPDGGGGGGDEPPQPSGHRDGWEMAFSDEFDGTSLDPGRWTDRSSALADEGRGNKDNRQLEWNRAENCRVSGGELTMTAHREAV